MTKISRSRTVIYSAIQSTITASDGNVHVGIVSVSPELATQWLDNADRVGFKNRTPSPASIAKYANEMANGKWAAGTYDPIHLAIEDGLAFPINGRHRLSAVIQSGLTIEFLVVAGVSRANFRYYDQGRPRDLPQIIDIVKSENHGNLWKYPQPMATTSRLLFKQDKTGNPTIRPSDDDNDQDGVIFDTIDETYGELLNHLYNDNYKQLSEIQRGEKIVGQVKSAGFGPIGIWGFAMIRAVEQGCAESFSSLVDYASAPSQNRSPAVPWKTLLSFIAQIREEAQEGHGRVMKGRHKDFSDAVLAAIFVAVRGFNDGARFSPCNGEAIGRNGTENKWFREFNDKVVALLLSRNPADWSLVS